MNRKKAKKKLNDDDVDFLLKNQPSVYNPQ